MARLIDVRKAIEDAEDDASFKDGLGTVRDVQMFLDGQEIVDAVPVVRCKDCIWWEYGKSEIPYCNHVTAGMYFEAKDNDFCSYGERREVKDNGKL